MTTLEIENNLENEVEMGAVTQLETSLTNSAFYDTNTFTKHSDESFSATLQKAIDFSTNTSQNGHEDAELNDKQFYYSSGSNYFLLEKNLKAETIKNMPINQIPFTPNWFMGIVNIRGIIMPVINIQQFVNFQTNAVSQDNSDSDETQQNESYLLKLEHQNHSPIVFKVDSLPRQISINKVKKRTKINNKPVWMLNTLDNDTNSIIEIDHHQLLSQIKELS
ncbi:chemotaxis protein CheW [Cocleimonas sp. KMM 6892]|uniref:chemotaxis protein CheW n=1 Tax=unclassified Cocleimonas TaxID=2639732 RepID=UPI002DBD945E|nr:MULTISPECIES: chemotaxis protein CheW [unclassified Cocleimonas]MEB8433721.1 chemotaxis protein CheW [Cocleimonas sp. KMM 6892]MEC4716532.1 chemotaxis protein CheW [Cocleimonas sp. KMM 6895]MEC4746313.1 chemotaxis protein CheW [Cocleimonas sp. KMM 6896]